MNIQSLVWLIVSGVYNNYDFRWMDMLDFICNGSIDLFGSGRERQIQNENICLKRDRTHTTPVHDRKVSALDRSATRAWWWSVVNVLLDNGTQILKKLLRDNTCQFDYGYMCIWTECETKLSFLISLLLIASLIFVYRTLHWVSNRNRFHTGIVTYPFQNTVRL